jgi:hypothetical protein
MVTLRRDTPPDAMEIGEKLLLISAGKAKTWAATFLPGFKKIETISATTRKGTTDFCIFYPLHLQ